MAKVSPEKRILNCAKSKVKHIYKREWCGFLTPCEIIALCGAGVHPRNKYSIEYAQRDKDAGESRSTWFYFQIGKLNLDQK